MLCSSNSCQRRVTSRHQNRFAIHQIRTAHHQQLHRSLRIARSRRQVWNDCRKSVSGIFVVGRYQGQSCRRGRRLPDGTRAVIVCGEAVAGCWCGLEGTCWMRRCPAKCFSQRPSVGNLRCQVDECRRRFSYQQQPATAVSVVAESGRGWHAEQQVGQTLTCFECWIWELVGVGVRCRQLSGTKLSPDDFEKLPRLCLVWHRLNYMSDFLVSNPVWNSSDGV